MKSPDIICRHSLWLNTELQLGGYIHNLPIVLNLPSEISIFRIFYGVTGRQATDSSCTFISRFQQENLRKLSWNPWPSNYLKQKEKDIYTFTACTYIYEMKHNTGIVYVYDRKTRTSFNIRLISCTDKRKCKGKGHPRTGHEGPEWGVDV
jgi:hypothetical protein